MSVIIVMTGCGSIAQTPIELDGWYKDWESGEFIHVENRFVRPEVEGGLGLYHYLVEGGAPISSYSIDPFYGKQTLDDGIKLDLQEGYLYLDGVYFERDSDDNYSERESSY